MTDLLKDKPDCILFDLDGTLADSASDLAAAMNTVRVHYGLPAMDESLLRPHASGGAPALASAAFHISPKGDLFPKIRELFLAYYREHLADRTTLFPGIPEILAYLDERNIPWGIVTNKVTSLAKPVSVALGISHAKAFVCGDTTGKPKPSPEPVLEACRQAGVSPEKTWFVGDDRRDVIAGKAAGTKTIAAGWGYCTDAQTWDADALFDSPTELFEAIKKAYR